MINTFNGGELEFDFSDAEQTFSEGTINGVPYVDASAIFFRAGKYAKYPDRFTDENVHSIAAQFKDGDVPLQIDHDADALPVGKVRSMFAEGSPALLKGVARFIGTTAVENYKGGNWKKLSIGLTKTLAPHHVGIVRRPACAGAQVFSESEETTVSVDAKENQGAAMDFSAKLAEIEKQFSDRTAKMQADFEAKFTAQETQTSALKAESDELKSALKFSERVAKIDQFSEQGRILPAQRERELALIKTFSDEQFAAWETETAKMDPVIDFSVRGYAEHTRPGSTRKQEDIEAEIADLQKTTGRA